MKLTKQAAIFIFVTAYSSLSWSEIYQWKDTKGQTHYSDKQPKDSKPKEISSQLKNINLSSDLTSPELMLEYEKIRESEAQAEKKALIKKLKSIPSSKEWCAKAKTRLKKLKGRVNFVDNNNKPVTVSEEDKKSQALSLSKLISKHCQ